MGAPAQFNACNCLQLHTTQTSDQSVTICRQQNAFGEVVAIGLGTEERRNWFAREALAGNGYSANRAHSTVTAKRRPVQVPQHGDAWTRWLPVDEQTHYFLEAQQPQTAEKNQTVISRDEIATYKRLAQQALDLAKERDAELTNATENAAASAS